MVWTQNILLSFPHLTSSDSLSQLQSPYGFCSVGEKGLDGASCFSWSSCCFCPLGLNHKGGLFWFLTLSLLPISSPAPGKVSREELVSECKFPFFCGSHGFYTPSPHTELLAIFKQFQSIFFYQVCSYLISAPGKQILTSYFSLEASVFPQISGQLVILQPQLSNSLQKSYICLAYPFFPCCKSGSNSSAFYILNGSQELFMF